MLGVYDYTVILTYISLWISIGGMMLSLNGHLDLAVLCLALSGLCDMFDGKIARTKKDRTEIEKRFGIQIDSLCDIVCFGVGQAIICYCMGMNGIVGVLILMFYVLAGLIRLAWFNVTEECRQDETTENRKCYQGLPITSMSIALPILVVLRPFLHCDFRIALHAMVLLVGLCISRSSSGCSSLDIETKIHVRGEIMIYADRNGNRMEKTTGQDRFLEYIYGHTLTRMMLKPLLGFRVSRLGGKVLDSRVSKLLIPSFVRKNQIDLSIYEKKHYSSYNDFFTRKILAEERPIDGRKEVLISPCDGKVTVCPIQRDGLFLIKQTQYTVRSLLKDEKLAKRYEGGTAYIIRLTVDDYHRYCYVADGVKSAQRKIRGVFHTVNPVANDYAPIYKMNTREYCLVQTEELGTVLQMEVGALMVGRIKNHKKKVSVVHRGEEKGMFEFGGSTVVLLTEPGKVQTDEDLVRNSATGAETLVKMGEKIGSKK